MSSEIEREVEISWIFIYSFRCGKEHWMTESSWNRMERKENLLRATMTTRYFDMIKAPYFT
jgi:hypothetical protein